MKKAFTLESGWGCLSGFLLWAALMAVAVWIQGWGDWPYVLIAGFAGATFTTSVLFNLSGNDSQPRTEEEIRPTKVPIQFYPYAALAVLLLADFGLGNLDSISEKWKRHEEILNSIFPLLAGIWAVDIFFRQAAKNRREAEAKRPSA